MTQFIVIIFLHNICEIVYLYIYYTHTGIYIKRSARRIPKFYMFDAPIFQKYKLIQNLELFVQKNQTAALVKKN